MEQYHFTEGEVGMDYGMGMAFKAIPAYNAAMNPAETVAIREFVEAMELFRRPPTKSLFKY